MDHKNENEKIKTLLKDFIDEIFEFRRNIREEKIFNDISQETLIRIEEMEIPETGRPVCDVYKEMTEDVFSNVVRVQHPRSFACVPGPASVFSWMGEVMTSAYNPHASCSSNAPAANLIEKKLIRWMCDLAGYPKNSGGLFVSGGSMANLTALTAARDAKLRPQERRDAVAYISGQTHSSLAKALHIIGFDRNQIRKVCVDGAISYGYRRSDQTDRKRYSAGKKTIFGDSHCRHHQYREHRSPERYRFDMRPLRYVDARRRRFRRFGPYIRQIQKIAQRNRIVR